MMNLFPPRRIYLDYASTTPVLKEVEKEMSRFWRQDFHNPSSIYKEGVAAKSALDSYRRRVAKVLHVSKRDIVFTASGTEANNLAILGTFEKALETMKKPQIIVSAIEHPSVMEAAFEVERRGGEISVVPVDEHGVIKFEVLKKLIKKNTFLISIMLANNELGTIEPVAKVGRLVREVRAKRGSSYPYLHTDASQAPNYLPINVETFHADLLTLDASKIYGPKGIGLLVVRPSVGIRPITLGGGQERGLRSGTESLALIAGFSKALEIADKDREKEVLRMKNLQKFFMNEVGEIVPNAVINTPELSLPNIVSVSIPNKLSELLALAFDRKGVMVSTGSSCSLRDDNDGSDVLRAIGKPDLASATLRFSFGRFTTEKDLRKVLKIFSVIASV